jgi:hypothetical protein
VDRETRRTQNEVWFREVNERLEARALARDGSGTSFEIVCECAFEECTDRIPIVTGAYEEVRALPTHFVLVVGHEDLALERVVEVTKRYQVVEKVGRAAAIADAANPRR